MKRSFFLPTHAGIICCNRDSGLNLEQVTNTGA